MFDIVGLKNLEEIIFLGIKIGQKFPYDDAELMTKNLVKNMKKRKIKVVKNDKYIIQ